MFKVLHLLFVLLLGLEHELDLVSIPLLDQTLHPAPFASSHPLLLF